MLVLSSIGGAVAGSLCLLFGAGLLLAFCAYSFGGAIVFLATGLLYSRRENESDSVTRTFKSSAPNPSQSQPRLARQ